MGNDSDYHKTIRTLTEQPIQTAGDKEFTPDEIGNAKDAINCKKAQGETGITGDIFQRAYKRFLNLINTLRECLRRAAFRRDGKGKR